MDSVRLDAASGSATSLSLVDPRFQPDQVAGSDTYYMECLARLDADGQFTEVALRMIQPYREDAVDFFEKLASLPDDWDGGANWHSESGEIRLDLEGQPSGRMSVRVELRQMAHLQATADGEFLVRTDELRRFASSLGEFMRVPPTPTGWKSPDASRLGRWSFTSPPPSTRHA